MEKAVILAGRGMTQCVDKARCHYEQQFINVHVGSGGQDRRQRIRATAIMGGEGATRTDKLKIFTDSQAWSEGVNL
jgi:hypothetical protein